VSKIDRRYGKWLSKLKDDRENGDYDIYTDFDRGDAEASVQNAKAFVGEMRRYLSRAHGLEM
jgi:uncharacterized protein (UPF0332 family)